MLQFEWDPVKARMNLRKHEVAFKEAATVFKDPWSINTCDPDHSEEEEGSIMFGAWPPVGF